MIIYQYLIVDGYNLNQTALILGTTRYKVNESFKLIIEKLKNQVLN